MDLVVVVPFNDLAAVALALAAHRGRVAGMILEPVMMNAGIIPPDPGYLAGLRDLLHAEGALLTFDEVKTGFTTGPAGATGRYGVVPDLVCLAKALGGGIPVAAIGAEAVMSAIADGRYEQVGTFNGSPLAMAATRASLTRTCWTTPATPTSSSSRTGPGAGSRSSPPTGWAGGSSAWGPRVRRLHRLPRAQLPRLPGGRRPLGSAALASAAQWWGVPPTVGQGRAVAAVGPAHRRRRRPPREQLRTAGAGGRRPRGRLMPGGALSLVALTKSFGDVVAVDGIDLERPPASSARCSAPRAAARPPRCG